MRAIFLLAVLLGITLLCTWNAAADELYEGVLSDVHAHVKGGVDLERIIGKLDQAHVDRIVITRRDSDRVEIGAGIPLVTDAELEEFRNRHPDRVVLGFGLQIQRWYDNDERFIAEIRRQALSGSYQLLGEASLRGHEGEYLYVAPSSPLFRQLLAIAAEAKLPLLLHHTNTVPAELEPLRAALRTQPAVPVIWAHWCGLSRPEQVRELFGEFPNLYCDLAWARKRNMHYPVMLVDSAGRLLPEWKALIEAYPGRFLAGVDVTTREHYAKYPQFVRRVRVALGGLQPETARLVATGNFHRLFPAGVDARAGRVAPPAQRGNSIQRLVSLRLSP